MKSLSDYRQLLGKYIHDLRLLPTFLKLLVLRRKVAHIEPESFLQCCRAGYRIIDADDREIGGAEFERIVAELHSALQECVDNRSVVAVSQKNNAHTLAVIVALMRSGATIAVIPNAIGALAIQGYLKSSQATHWVFESDEDVSGKHGIALSNTRAISMQHSLGELPASSDRTLSGYRGFLVFTSGTSGLPKAVKIPFQRLLQEMVMYSVLTHCTRSDRIYLTLPMCHRDGLLFGLMSIFFGATLIIRRRYSSEDFFRDLAAYRFTIVPYLGEIARYVASAAEHRTAPEQSILCWNGSGMSKTSWEKLKRIWPKARIVETYGSSEGNVGLLNYDYIAGSAGSIPFYAKFLFSAELIESEADANGKIRLVCGEGVGEGIGKVFNPRAPNYCEYLNEEAGAKRLLSGVKVENDLWCRTGDVFFRDNAGHFYFQGRIGRNFRWKSINTSSMLVEDIAEQFAGVRDAVCGPVQIPGYEGSAGLLVVYKGDDFDTSSFSRFVTESIQKESIPLFVRFLDSCVEATDTYKKRWTSTSYEDIKSFGDVYYYDKPSRAYQSFCPDKAGRLESQQLSI